jgi:hypothetical protein
LKWLGILILSLAPFISLATHNRAGEITYRPLCPPGTQGPCLKYEITVTLYTKCDGGVSADRCEITLSLSNGDSILLQRKNGYNTTTNPCSNQAVCSHGFQGEYVTPTNTSIKKSIYKGEYTFTGLVKCG